MQSFHEYITRVETFNLHSKEAPQLALYCPPLSPSLCHLPNLVFYGAPGIGKYSQALFLLSKHGKLTNRKKIAIYDDTKKSDNKPLCHIWASDIHYEIDMQELTRETWHVIHQQICEIVSARPLGEKHGVIMCLNFHRISPTLLNSFHTFMQMTAKRISPSSSSSPVIRFLFITETLTFIPPSILHTCDVVSLARPSMISYARAIHANHQMGCSISQIQDDLRKEYVRPRKTITNFEACQLGFTHPRKSKTRQQCVAIQNRHVPFVKRRPISGPYLNDMRLLDVDVENVIWEIIKRQSPSSPHDELLKMCLNHGGNLETLLIQLAEKTK